jgi:hypothetical protein
MALGRVRWWHGKWLPRFFSVAEAIKLLPRKNFAGQQFRAPHVLQAA